MLADFGEDFADQHRFQVPEGCHWPDVRAAPKNVGTALSNSMRGVEVAYPAFPHSSCPVPATTPQYPDRGPSFPTSRPTG